MILFLKFMIVLVSVISDSSSVRISFVMECIWNRIVLMVCFNCFVMIRIL